MEGAEEGVRSEEKSPSITCIHVPYTGINVHYLSAASSVPIALPLMIGPQLFLVLCLLPYAWPLCASPKPPRSDPSPSELLRRAESLRSEADALKSSLPPSASSSATPSPSPSAPAYTHRLSLDIGREPNTWMDPSWGRSGKRLLCSVDVSFSSPPVLEADRVRLRGGFDGLEVEGARWSLAGGKLLLELDTAGTEGRPGYGDVFVPAGTLYVSLGSLGDPRANANNVSVREGVICVKQRGWHTGLPRMENRIAGIARIKVV